jgi:hypothetical protein
MRELFRAIEGYERYSVSDAGRVFSAIGASRFLKPTIGPNGYGYVSLMARGASRPTRFNVHVLVARAFLPNADGKRTVNHKNGDKLDCRADNLEWATYAEQQEHALSTGLNRAFGETHYAAKVTWHDVEEIRWQASTGILHKDLAAKYGCARQTITKIVNRLTWERRP